MSRRKSKVKYDKKKPHRVPMTPEEREMWNDFKSNQESAEETLQEFAKRKEINLNDVHQVWHKGKYFSVKTKPGSVTYDQVKDDLIAQMNQHSPNYFKIKRDKITDGHLLVIDISDLHLNKHAEKELTGEDYNSDIAVKRALEGTRGLLKKASGYNISKILFVIGNDVLNTDTISRTTTSGTPQDTDLHWFKAFQLARKCYVVCIEMCMQVADVDVVHCPSNHDFMSGCFLADSLQSWFRKSDNVTFNISPSYRKYYQYHSNMLEFEHGDKGKAQNIPLLMAQEKPHIWASTKFRYAYLHHVHHQDKKQFQSGKDYIGVNVTYLRSPSSADLWHSDQGYKSQVAVEAFIHSKFDGRVAHLTHYF